MTTPKPISLTVSCFGGCPKKAEAPLRELRKGVYGVLPPDNWLIQGVNNVLSFICEDCAERLGIRCKGENHGNEH